MILVSKSYFSNALCLEEEEQRRHALLVRNTLIYFLENQFCPLFVPCRERERAEQDGGIMSRVH